VRGGADSADGAASDPRRLFLPSRRPWRDAQFWLLSFGAASGSILGYGLIFWLPSFFARSFHLGAGAGRLVSTARSSSIGGVAGTWLGGWFGDAAGPGDPGAYALIPAICF
jgi:hypothetical protein